MSEALLRERLVELRPPSEVTRRVLAARSLSEDPWLPAWCAAPLVAALDDDASYGEDWTDWNGSIVGGETHRVTEYARRALLRVGAPALEVLKDAPAHRALLSEIVAAAPPEALAALTEATRAALPSLVEGTPWQAEALLSLRWRDAEGVSETQRLLGRLRHHTDAVVVAACEALARGPLTTEIADAVFARLARPLPAAEGALEALAPHVSDGALEAFLATRVGPKDDPPFPVLRAVLAWGPRAKSASSALLALLKRKVSSANVVMEATLPAMVVAAVLGPPTTVDDPRVHLFRLLREQKGKVLHVPTDRLEVLVKACGGGAHLSPFVLDELTKKLIEGPNEARVDAVPRLFALREAAEPAGDALLVALDALMLTNWNIQISATCWALAHAGAARLRALPKFIAMLEGPHASSALHGLHGMSEDAAEALPAVEAYLARAATRSDREAAERLLRRIKHLAKVAP